MHLRAVPLASSLPLQKLLFFNFYYSILFGAVHVAMMSYKIAYLQLDTAGLYAAPAILTVWALCEIARLRLGYAGNLKEKVIACSCRLHGLFHHCVALSITHLSLLAHRFAAVPRNNTPAGP